MPRDAFAPACAERRPFAPAERLRLLPVLFVGGYVLLTTVAPLVLDEGAPSSALAAAGVGAVALLGAPLAPRRWLSLVLGVDVFVASCFLALLLAHRAGVDGALGVPAILGWVALPLAWGALSTPGRTEVAADAGPRLAPRVAPSRLVLGLLALAVGTVAFVISRVVVSDRPWIDVLWRVVALAVCLFCLRGASDIAARLQASAPSSPPRPAEFAPALVAVALAALLAWLL